MDLCLNCQFYDRKRDKSGGTQSVRSGQCRRTAPMLSPIQAKAYLIEGVWPTVRDDDWCGEWKATACRTDSRRPESHAMATGALHALNGSARAAPIHGSGTKIAVATVGPMIASPPMAVAGISGE